LLTHLEALSWRLCLYPRASITAALTMTSRRTIVPAGQSDFPRLGICTHKQLVKGTGSLWLDRSFQPRATSPLPRPVRPCVTLEEERWAGGDRDRLLEGRMGRSVGGQGQTPSSKTATRTPRTKQRFSAAGHFKQLSRVTNLNTDLSPAKFAMGSLQGAVRRRRCTRQAAGVIVLYFRRVKRVDAFLNLISSKMAPTSCSNLQAHCRRSELRRVSIHWARPYLP